MCFALGATLNASCVRTTKKKLVLTMIDNDVDDILSSVDCRYSFIGVMYIDGPVVTGGSAS